LNKHCHNILGSANMAKAKRKLTDASEGNNKRPKLDIPTEENGDDYENIDENGNIITVSTALKHSNHLHLPSIEF
jgi:hypothetical protein